MSLDTVYIVETPEGIALSLQPAGLVPRSLAYMIDFAIRMLLLMLVGIVAAAFKGLGGAVVLVAYFGIEWFYPVVFELGRRGATPGKRMMGLHVVMDSGLPVTPAASIVRNLLRAADFLPIGYAFGFCSMLLRGDFKRMGDLAAGTLVVYSRAAQLHGVVPPAEPLEPVRALTLREQAAIVAWAERATRITPERMEELARLVPPLVAQPLASSVSTSATERLLGVAQWLLGRRGTRAVR